MVPGLIREKKLLENRPKSSPMPVLIFSSSIPCVFCLYILLKVVSCYYFSVLYMSVMGFQKKFGWWVGGVSPMQFYFGFLVEFSTLQSP